MRSSTITHYIKTGDLRNNPAIVGAGVAATKQVDTGIFGAGGIGRYEVSDRDVEEYLAQIQSKVAEDERRQRGNQYQDRIDIHRVQHRLEV